ncbi:hypothetical protein F0562_032168 [Nyssa sinensis]|uniref:Uncharacterized protein n=1 Tax=Nyssa sinensis TaxID=561372 RepID=A0A5J5B079_9ASTE|nr:hypothetical protein F0562_032168 [Nyssa sinensis]
MQGDALATNSAHRPAIRSSASAAGVHSVEGSFGVGVPITLPASAVCTRETSSNTNGLEPTIHSTLGIRDIPNASPDLVRLVANQIGGTPQVSTSDAATQPASFTQDTELPNNYDIQMIKTMEIGATSTATFLDNSGSTSANASQPKNSSKITEQQETPYAIQPIKPMEIGTTSRDPILDCPDILQRESYQHPSGQELRCRCWCNSAAVRQGYGLELRMGVVVEGRAARRAVVVAAIAPVTAGRYEYGCV